MILVFGLASVVSRGGLWSRHWKRLAAVARFYGNQIGVKYGEPFVVKETMRVDDIVTMGPRSF